MLFLSREFSPFSRSWEFCFRSCTKLHPPNFSRGRLKKRPKIPSLLRRSVVSVGTAGGISVGGFYHKG